MSATPFGTAMQSAREHLHGRSVLQDQVEVQPLDEGPGFQIYNLWEATFSVA